MTIKNKKILVPVSILAIALAFAWWSSTRRPDLDVRYADQPSTLTSEDLKIKTSGGVIETGISSFDEVAAQFPSGKTLGMSTVYYDKENGCTFTFTKHSNQLWVMQIEKSNLSTHRGIKVGDPFEPNVLNAYGDNYGSVRQPGNTKDFDIAYGDGYGSVIFQIRNHVVAKISLKKPPETY